MRRIFTILFICLGWMIAGTSHATDVAGQPLSVRMEREPVHYPDPVFRAYLTSGTNSFTFVMPTGFCFGPSQEANRLLMKSCHASRQLTFRLLPSMGPHPSIESLRAVALENRPGFQITSETANSPNFTGIVFELTGKTESGHEQKSRVVFMVSPAGLLEFTVTDFTQSFPTAQVALRGLIHSFVSSVNGKLTFERVTDSS